MLVIRDKTGQLYIHPGGRCEKGESALETLRRELLEETGWTLKDTHLLGFMHFHHLGPKPADYPYPYPDFLWPIYIAEAGTYVPEAMQDDDYVLDSKFYTIQETLELDIDKGYSVLPLLKAAIELRGNAKE